MTFCIFRITRDQSNAESETRNSSPRQAQEAAGACERLLPDQEQAVSRGERVGRYRAKYAYVGRKNKKRDFRRLWVVRINAAARENGLTYSQLMRGLKAAGITLDRKMLADMAVTQPAAFAKVAAQAKAALPVEPPPESMPNAQGSMRSAQRPWALSIGHRIVH